MTGLPHRTATTSCPCCIPALGDLEGASRVAPVRGKGNIEIRLAQNLFLIYDVRHTIYVPIAIGIAYA